MNMDYVYEVASFLLKDIVPFLLSTQLNSAHQLGANKQREICSQNSHTHIHDDNIIVKIEAKKLKKNLC